MRSVTQKHSFGCGVACVAFILKKSYEDVADILGEDKANNKGFVGKELVRTLSDFECPYFFKYLKPKLKRKIYQNGVIVFIKRSDKYPSGHYLVYFNSQWMDSWLNFTKDRDIKKAKSGFRKRLPGKPIYALFPKRAKL